MNKFTWPLAVSTFTLWDKLKIAKWLLSEDRYTMGKKVEELEAAFSEFSGMYALGVSSGSAANQLVFELWKYKNPFAIPLVIVPAVTWISSISPAIMAGMDIKFCDVNLNDFSFNYGMLEKILEENRNRKVIIWPTALIGFSPDMEVLNFMAKRYNAELYMDSCENTFSKIKDQSILKTCDITTTSCYFSHQVVAVEFGFVFFKHESDYILAKMFRNHGLSRSLKEGSTDRILAESMNPNVDPNFLFMMNGTNLRPTDVHAMFGLQDFKRVEKSKEHRDKIYRYFYEKLDKTLYYLPNLSDTQIGFCLPIFTKKENLSLIKSVLTSHGIEVRPIIGGNLLHQPPFKEYGNPTDFPDAEWIHTHGCYVGLHHKVNEKYIDKLTKILNHLDDPFALEHYDIGAL